MRKVIIFYTRHELTRLHLHFFYQSADKLFYLLRRGDRSKATPEVHKLLGEFTKACAECREFSARPYPFHFLVPPERIIFNHEVAIDLMWLENKPLLHVVWTHTHFGNETWVQSKSARDIWLAFLECWSTVYVGYPNKIRSDREAGVTSDLF